MGYNYQNTPPTHYPDGTPIVDSSKLSQAEIATLVMAKQANGPYFDALIVSVGKMAERRVEYSGKDLKADDPFTNFLLMHFIMNFVNDGTNQQHTYFFYIALKFLRLMVQVRDRSVGIDTLLDLANYALIFMGAIMSKKIQETIWDGENYASG